MPDAGLLEGTLLGSLLFGTEAAAGAAAGWAGAGALGAGLGAEAAGLGALGAGLGAAEGFGAGAAGAAGALGSADAAGVSAADAFGTGAAGAAGSIGDTAAALGGPGGDTSGALAGPAAAPTATSPPPMTVGAGVEGAPGAGVAPGVPASPVATGPTAAPLPGTAPPGAFDLTSNFATGPGSDVFSGATTTTQGTAAGGAAPQGFEGVGTAGGQAGGGFSPASLGPAQATTSTMDPTWLQTLGSKASSAVSPVTDAINSPLGKALGVGVSGLGLAKNLMTPASVPGQQQLQQLASALGATGTAASAAGIPGATASAQKATGQAATLENYLTTGTLPPAVQAQLDRATEDAVTAVKGQFAARGMPPGSSAEVAEINAVRQNATIQGGTLAAQLYSQGVSLDQLAANIYGQLTSAGTGATSAATGALGGVVNTNIAQNNGVNAAIANLSSALAGGRTTTAAAA